MVGWQSKKTHEEIAISVVGLRNAHLAENNRFTDIGSIEKAPKWRVLNRSWNVHLTEKWLILSELLWAEQHLKRSNKGLEHSDKKKWSIYEFGSIEEFKFGEMRIWQRSDRF